ncbi:MAG: transposase DNA-binding-containing protein [Pseudanabaena sp.]
MMNWWEKNFASCELGDERLSDRAYAIGKKLSEGFGKALSEIFKSGSELKRAYEFSAIAKQNLARS